MSVKKQTDQGRKYSICHYCKEVNTLNENN